MLSVVEDKNENIALQKSLIKLLSQEWRRREHRVVTWRPHSEQFEIHHDGNLWFASKAPNKHQRYWNTFGVYEPDGNLGITVEINIPTVRDGRVSGFFARDTDTGHVYLMHDGGIGGGGKGVGRASFLKSSRLKTVPVSGSKGLRQTGIIVAPLKTGLGVPLGSFVEKVADFKQAVRDGLVQPVSQTAIDSVDDDGEPYGDYDPEFSGLKKGQRARILEYISRHGDVVDELTRFRPVTSGERHFNDRYRDLGVKVNGVLTELYEVKTSAGRQALYSAIGQLLVHSNRATNVQRFVVVPDDEDIAPDVSSTLKTLSIRVLRYKLVGKGVEIRR